MPAGVVIFVSAALELLGGGVDFPPLGAAQLHGVTSLALDMLTACHVAVALRLPRRVGSRLRVGSRPWYVGSYGVTRLGWVMRVAALGAGRH